jgi:hypothetical protein
MGQLAGRRELAPAPYWFPQILGRAPGRAAVADHLGRAPYASRAHRCTTSRPQSRCPGRAQLTYAQRRCREHCRRSQLLGLAKPKVIMNDIRLRAPAVADNNTFDRESVHNHAQTARTLSAPYERGSRARLVQAEGLDSQAACRESVADALIELRQLERRLDRRMRRDHARQDPPFSSSLTVISRYHTQSTLRCNCPEISNRVLAAPISWVIECWLLWRRHPRGSCCRAARIAGEAGPLRGG